MSIPPEVFQNPALLGALQSRLSGLIGQDSGYISSLPEPIQRRLRALQNIQDKHLALETEFRKEVLELEKKYAELHKPMYEDRAKVVSGEREPSDEECVRAADEDEEEGSSGAKISQAMEDPDSANIKGIPEFWLTALKNHPLLNEMLTGEEDEEALKHLADIKTHYLTDNAGFKLEFVFQENPYFSDKSLFKTYLLSNNPDSPYGDMVYEKAEGSKISWKADKNLAVKIEVKKQRHKGTKETRTIKKSVPRETFFTFFTPLQVPENEEDFDEDDLPEDYEERIQMDYEVGETLKEKIIPRAVDWFTGKALEDEEFMGSDEDEEEEDWEGEEDDDEAEEDDDDEAPPRGGNAPPSTAVGEGEKPPECKQS